MPRVARIVLEGQPHHITQRGNNRQDVFFLDDDRVAYLELLRIHGEQFVILQYGPTRELSCPEPAGREVGWSELLGIVQGHFIFFQPMLKLADHWFQGLNNVRR